jgi:hypothetical protein
MLTYLRVRESFRHHPLPIPGNNPRVAPDLQRAAARAAVAGDPVRHENKRRVPGARARRIAELKRKHYHLHTPAYVSIRQHPSANVNTTSAYVSCMAALRSSNVNTITCIRRHMSAYVSIRQHTSACVCCMAALRSSNVNTITSRARTLAHCATWRRRTPESRCQTPHTSAYVSTRQHTSADVSIRQHTSAYVSIRQTPGGGERRNPGARHRTRQHTSAHVSIRQHTSAYVSIRQHTSAYVRHLEEENAGIPVPDTRIPRAALTHKQRRPGTRQRRRGHDSHLTYAHVIRQHTSAYVSIRQHTSAYVMTRTGIASSSGVSVSPRQHTSAYVSIREHTT